MMCTSRAWWPRCCTRPATPPRWCATCAPRATGAGGETARRPCWPTQWSRARAARRGGPSAVLTFTPHPARLFAPAKAPPLIMSLERRLELLAAAGIDIAVVEPFTRAFATIEAEEFVRRVLAQDLAAAEVVVG